MTWFFKLIDWLFSHKNIEEKKFNETSEVVKSIDVEVDEQEEDKFINLIMIDYYNLKESLYRLGIHNPDYVKILNGFKSKLNSNSLIEIRLYLDTLGKESPDNKWLYPLIKMGVKVFYIKKDLKLNKKTQTVDRISRVDDVMVLDTMQIVYENNVKNLLLFSGDGDFALMAERVIKKGVSVTIVSEEKSCNTKLRSVCSERFVDLSLVKKSELKYYSPNKYYSSLK